MYLALKGLSDLYLQVRVQNFFKGAGSSERQANMGKRPFDKFPTEKTSKKKVALDVTSYMHAYRHIHSLFI